jgi:hypothetical protein
VEVVDDLLSEIRQREAKNPATSTVREHNAAVSQTFPIWTQLVQNGFTSFGKQNILAAPPPKPGFSDPSPLSLKQMFDMVLTRSHAASDELGLVQTDADYVRYLISEVDGSLAAGTLDEKGIWAFKAQIVFIQPLLNKLWWDEVLGRARDLRDCLAAEGEGEKRPKKLDLLLAFMKEACTQQLVTQLIQLHASLLHEPGLDASLLDMPYAVDFRAIDPLFWALSTLGYDEDRDSTLPLSITLGFLQSYLAAHEEAKARLSSRLLKRITDVSILNDILVALQCRQGYNSRVVDERSLDNAVTISNEKLKIGRFERVWAAVGSDQLSQKAGPHLRLLCSAVDGCSASGSLVYKTSDDNNSDADHALAEV